MAWLSTMTAPADGSSNPARILRIVVLPQPEWPMTQVNSPRRIVSQRSSNTTVSACAAAKRLLIPSSEMNISEVIRLLGETDGTGQTRQDLVKRHTDDTNDDNGCDHIGDREIVPLIPNEIADPGAADEHLRRHDDQPSNPDRDPHAGEDRRRCGRKNYGERTPDSADLER